MGEVITIYTSIPLTIVSESFKLLTEMIEDGLNHLILNIEM